MQIIDDIPAAPSGTANGSFTESQPPTRLSFFLDGAHTPESMESCGQWFGEAADSRYAAANAQTDPEELHRVLLFHCMKVGALLGHGLGIQARHIVTLAL